MNGMIALLLLINIGLTLVLLYRSVYKDAVEQVTTKVEVEQDEEKDKKQGVSYSQMVDEWFNGEEGDEQ